MTSTSELYGVSCSSFRSIAMDEEFLRDQSSVSSLSSVLVSAPSSMQSVNLTPSQTFIPETEAQYVDASKVEKPWWCPLFIGKIIGLVKDLFFTIGTLWSRRTNSCNYGRVVWKGNDNKKGIVVLIHGLNASPSQMDGHATAFRKKYGQQVMIHQVKVDLKGNCSKKDAVKRITDTVLPLMQQHPQMKLYAHGISNGGRLSCQLAVDLVENGIDAKRMMVNSNSAPLYGTKMMCDPETAPWRQKIWKWIVQSPLAGRHSEEIYNDFTYGSESGKQMIRNIACAAHSGVKFEFEGGFADSKVTPPSFYPSNVKNAEYFAPTSIQGHSSIIGSQRNRQVESAANFLGLVPETPENYPVSPLQYDSCIDVNSDI